MYHFSYQESVEDSPSEAREKEKQAFDHAIGLLELAERYGRKSEEARDALFFLDQFWMILMEDLASDENDLPERLRASLISIGIWMIKEINRIRIGQSPGFRALIDVNQIVRDGLS